jgi:transposase
VSQPIDIVQRSLPEPELLVLEAVEQIERDIVFRVRSRGTPRCPSCSGSEVSYHSTYVRRLRDLPWQGQPVQVQVKTRRLRCRNRHCPRKIFAERLPGVAAPQARETDRLTQTLRRVGYVLGGLPGSCLLRQMGMIASRDTILRRVKTNSGHPQEGKVRVLGVDDWAWRKQQRYGTMLMDLERRRVVDLLPVRSAGSFAEWLRLHPGVEMITRDRCGLYAEGGREGAPWAVQINDRYHLLSNLAEALEREVQQLQVQAREELAGNAEAKRSGRATLIEARRQRCRQARYEKYLAVVKLGRQGHTQLAIAEKFGMGADTVARWLGAPEFPERRIRSDRQRDRARFLQDQERGLHPALARTHFSAGRIAALLLKPSRGMSAAQQRYRDSFLRFCPGAYRVRKLALQFRAMLRWRRSSRLAQWIATVTSSGFSFLAQFARTLRRDLGAVELAIETPWNNGPIEGQINRLKVIKRQMYGRAGFELLKARVLPLSV